MRNMSERSSHSDFAEQLAVVKEKMIKCDLEDADLRDAFVYDYESKFEIVENWIGNEAKELRESIGIMRGIYHDVAPVAVLDELSREIEVALAEQTAETVGAYEGSYSANSVKYLKHLARRITQVAEVYSSMMRIRGQVRAIFQILSDLDTT